MSKLDSAPRWTPPMPPVAKTSMPARRAQIIVAATVVAPVQPSDERDGEVGAGELAHVARRGERVELGGSRPTRIAPPIDGDGRGHGAGGADLGLDGAGGLEVRGEGHAVGDDGRFERDQRAAGGDGLGDLGGEGERRGQDHGASLAMWRAAASSASSQRGGGIAAVGAGGEVGRHQRVAGAGDAGRRDGGRRAA